jgi:fatty acid desaturase
MTSFRLIGATALSLALAIPAMADGGKRNHHHHHRYVRDLDAPPNGLTVENATRWGYGQGYGAYHTGFGGLYGDGNYPGNVYYVPPHKG